ncbi:MAG: RNA polymerase sigma factor [Candidatus Riflebacteria bacterium]|nr:RNA polymerase sigma factor [Candidatus Riflebacteria bacterium]
MNDEEAIKLAKQGRQEGFKNLFTNHADFLFSNAFRILGNRTMAEDTIQDTFSAAFKAIASFKGNSKFRTWLYKIMYRNSLRIIKQNKEISPNELIKNNEAETNIINTKLDVEKVLNLLNERERTILLLVYHDDLPLKDVAEVLEINENNAKIVLYRARKHFSEIWTRFNEKEVGTNEV